LKAAATVRHALEMRRFPVAVMLIIGCNHGPLVVNGNDPNYPMSMPPSMQAPAIPTDAVLTFAVFGDARPPNPDDTADYPSTVLGSIFMLAGMHGAQFVIGTGDYMFASTQQAVTDQVALFKQAESNFSGPIYLTMGNHECTGATASNCPSANETPNVQAFMSLLPEGTTLPYYRIDLDTPKGKAKLVFVAANAWSDAQALWLEAQLADATPYTFVMRHEAPSVTETPGVSPSELTIAAHPFTLELLGHTHAYKRLDSRRVISGNGGAPIRSYDGGSGYGFLLVQLLSDGNVAATEISQANGMPIDTWRVSPTGQSVQ
jgi:hypothetical protein